MKPTHRYIVGGLGLTAIVAVGLLMGCAASSSSTTSDYNVRQTLLAADGLALAYLAQPPCGAVVAVSCVDPAVKARIKAASAAVTVARHSADSAGLAGAVVAFAAVVQPLAKGSGQ